MTIGADTKQKSVNSQNKITLVLLITLTLMSCSFIARRQNFDELLSYLQVCCIYHKK
jgi:hypothetical protein